MGNCGQSWFSCCVPVSLIHLWPPAWYNWSWADDCLCCCLTRRWKSPWVERCSHLLTWTWELPVPTDDRRKCNKTIFCLMFELMDSLENATGLQKFIQRHFRNFFKLDFPHSWWNTWINLQCLCYTCDYLSWLCRLVLTLKPSSAAQLHFNLRNIFQKCIMFCMYFLYFLFFIHLQNIWYFNLLQVQTDYIISLPRLWLCGEWYQLWRSLLWAVAKKMFLFLFHQSKQWLCENKILPFKNI